MKTNPQEPELLTCREWEVFYDTGYFDMWCVRPKGETRFGIGYHLATEIEANSLAKYLSTSATPPKAEGMSADVAKNATTQTAADIVNLLEECIEAGGNAIFEFADKAEDLIKTRDEAIRAQAIEETLERAKAAANAEMLIDNTQESDDIAYNAAIAHVILAIDDLKTNCDGGAK